ncbi:hypothetical protein N658DRAFT_497869 [Parathielavia hyrcaniae]|uniref:Uncharacterized protein n=1 Tax=Parathielavia hyrcaniae TaxID=113614 RepID=A0AAN6Q1B9_9PEZI|nr:hypothetical protein N658DRAFT_497869 [Parathielavia hyrcaniae]
MCVLIKVLCRNTDVLSFFVVCLPHIRYNLYSSRIQGWLDLQLGFREVEPELTSSASQISNFILAPSWIIHRYAQSQSSSMVMLDAPASPGINSVIHVAVGGAFHPFAQSPPRAVLDTYVSSRYLIFPSIKRFPNSRSRQRGGSGEKFHEFLGYSVSRTLQP